MAPSIERQHALPERQNMMLEEERSPNRMSHSTALSDCREKEYMDVLTIGALQMRYWSSADAWDKLSSK